MGASPRETLLWDSTEIAEDLNRILASENFEISDAEIIQIEKTTKNSTTDAVDDSYQNVDDQWRVSGVFNTQIGNLSHSEGSDEEEFNSKTRMKKSFSQLSSSSSRKFRASAALEDILSPDEIKAIEDTVNNDGAESKVPSDGDSEDLEDHVDDNSDHVDSDSDHVDNDSDNLDDDSDQVDSSSRSSSDVSRRSSSGALRIDEPRFQKSFSFRESAALDDLLMGEDLEKAQRTSFLRLGWRVSLIDVDIEEVMNSQDVETYLESHLLEKNNASRNQPSSKKFRVSAALEDLAPELLSNPQTELKLPEVQLNLELGFETVRDGLSDAFRSIINLVKESESNNIALFALSCRRLKENIEDIVRRSTDLISEEGVQLEELVKRSSRAIYDVLGAILTNVKLRQRGSSTIEVKQKLVSKLKIVRDLRAEMSKFSRESLLEKKKAEERKRRDLEREKRRLEREERRKQGERLVIWKKDVDDESHVNRISIVVEKYNT